MTSRMLTGDSVDPVFNDPRIDVDEMRTIPSPHRYVNGHFEGTKARFSFYFPPPDRYEGRFFQNTHPAYRSEDGEEERIAFALASGAYFVRTNMGRVFDDGPHMVTQEEAAVGGYVVNAEAAKYSRVVAAEMYGEHRPFGYLYGGSGGSFQSIVALEHTIDVWDGAVPCVMGTPSALPLNLLVRLLPLRALRRGNRFPAVMDAIDPGGSGDMYAGLDEEERSVLEEATRMGFPPRGWWNWETMSPGALISFGLARTVPEFDPTYVEDFWNKPGYLGADPTSWIRVDRVEHEATVVDVTPGLPIRLELSSAPEGELAGADLIVLSGAAQGERVDVGGVADTTVNLGIVTDPAIAERLRPGDRVRIDNSWLLALHTYNRHQVPGPDEYAYDQYRGPDGTPIHPQRDRLVGHLGTRNAAGYHETGHFNGKMIVVQALVDIDAFPWQADWYRTKVREALGDRVDDCYRLWFVDHAQHVPVGGLASEARTVGYVGVVQQALRDMSAWVERGVAPPASTEYGVVDTQVVVPGRAADRKGIQPVVELRANGSERADVGIGEPVVLSATIELPPDAGTIVAVEWDFEGVGDYPFPADPSDLGIAEGIEATHTYSEPGTYFPVVRVTSQREGDASTPWARVQNLARARVVVT